MRLPRLGGGWRLRLVALLVGLALPLWTAYRAYGGPPTGFDSPRARLWSVADFGIQHYDFPGQLPNGEAVILHIWLKALRSENSILLRAVGWVEALEEILHNSRAPQILRQPDGTYLFAVQPGLLYLRGLSSDKVFSLTVERVPHTENVVRPLTFALELSVAEASEDLFMLRIAGWRKFFVVSIGDMLAATDRLGAPDTPGHGSRAQPAFYIACSRFLPGTNMKTAAHLMYLHMHHHLKLGFQCSETNEPLEMYLQAYTLFLAREHAEDFMAHPVLARHIAEGRLWLVCDNFGPARISIGTDKRFTDNHDLGIKMDKEHTYPYQALTYSLALLRHWNGLPSNYVALIDVDEYIVIDQPKVLMPDIGRHCLANTALVLLSNYLTTCQLSAGCSVADNPGLWLDSDPAVRHPITMMTAINVTARVTSRKSLALAGYVSAFYVHDGVAEQGYKTLTMLETKHWDSCPIYLLHLVNMWRARMGDSRWLESRERDHNVTWRPAKWLWMYQ